MALTTWTTWSRSRVDGQGEWGERECASKLTLVLRGQIVFARWEVWTILQFVYTHTPPSHSLKSLCLLSLPWRCPEGASSSFYLYEENTVGGAVGGLQPQLSSSSSLLSSTQP